MSQVLFVLAGVMALTQAAPVCGRDDTDKMAECSPADLDTCLNSLDPACGQCVWNALTTANATSTEPDVTPCWTDYFVVRGSQCAPVNPITDPKECAYAISTLGRAADILPGGGTGDWTAWTSGCFCADGGGCGFNTNVNTITNYPSVCKNDMAAVAAAALSEVRPADPNSLKQALANQTETDKSRGRQLLDPCCDPADLDCFDACSVCCPFSDFFDDCDSDLDCFVCPAMSVCPFCCPGTTSPTASPTSSPTASPTASPTVRPTKAPTKNPTNDPTAKDWSAAPSLPQTDPKLQLGLAIAAAALGRWRA